MLVMVLSLTASQQASAKGSWQAYTTWLAVVANRNQAFSIRHKGTQHEKFVPSRRRSYTLSYVRVALATLDVQSILDIPATDEIHMEDRNHGLAWTKPNSDIYNTQHSQQTCAVRVHFKSCGYRTI